MLHPSLALTNLKQRTRTMFLASTVNWVWYLHLHAVVTVNNLDLPYHQQYPWAADHSPASVAWGQWCVQISAPWSSLGPPPSPPQTLYRSSSSGSVVCCSYRTLPPTTSPCSLITSPGTAKPEQSKLTNLNTGNKERFLLLQRGRWISRMLGSILSGVLSKLKLCWTFWTLFSKVDVLISHSWVFGWSRYQGP